MNRSHLKGQTGLGASLAMLCLVAGGALQAALAMEPVAAIRLSPAGIEWSPHVAYERLDLIISGPEGFYFRQEFDAGEVPSFEVFDEAGAFRADGVYKYELRVTPRLTPGERESLAARRDSGFSLRPQVELGWFSIAGGSVVPQDVAEAPGAGAGGSHLATRATVLTNADGVIRNSLCVGFDCPNSPSFSDTTILMMENNTRIKFDDTSNSASFPNNDWEIEANSNLNGGANYLGFNDCGNSSQGGCATDLVFAVEAGVRQSALYVEADGDVGFGTANPVVNLHVIDGNTPTLRLEQDGSSGFTPQTWDVAGNETNFFIRDATGGSTLPFRIQPGADSNSIFIASDNDVGVGTSAPDAELHVRRTDASRTEIRVENANAGAQAAAFRMQNSSRTWEFQADTVGNVLFRDVTQNSNPFVIEPAVTNEVIRIDSGNGGRVGIRTGNNVNFTLEVNGTIGVTGTGQVHPDYIFEPDYQLESIDEHSTYMFKHRHLPAVGAGQYDAEGRAIIDLGARSQGVLEELEKAHLYIDQLHQRLKKLEQRQAAGTP